MFSAAAMKTIYVVDLKDETDEHIKIIVSVFEAVREMRIMVQFLLEYLPIVGHIPKWAPGGSIIQKLRDARRTNRHIVEVDFAEARARVVSSPQKKDQSTGALNAGFRKAARTPRPWPLDSWQEFLPHCQRSCSQKRSR